MSIHPSQSGPRTTDDATQRDERPARRTTRRRPGPAGRGAGFRPRPRVCVTAEKPLLFNDAICDCLRTQAFEIARRGQNTCKRIASEAGRAPDLIEQALDFVGEVARMLGLSLALFLSAEAR